MVPVPDRKPETVNDRALLVWSPTKDIADTKCESLGRGSGWMSKGVGSTGGHARKEVGDELEYNSFDNPDA